MALTPSSFDSAFAPPSVFYVVHRDAANPSNFMFQKITDPIGAFGMNRSPPHHFLLRLRDFPPNLQDVIVVSSTASNDIGLFSRSKVPLTNDKPAEKVTGVFTMTEMSDDSRRAQLPMSAELNDTSPIGLAFDLSSKDKVHKPIPSYEEINESPTPLPALMVLNNEGVLASWWFIYSDSIRQGTMYSGLVAAASDKPASNPSPAMLQGSTSAFGAPAKPAFGSPAAGSSGPPSAFSASTGAFGGPSALGQNKSPWGLASTTSSAPVAVGAFGGPSALGQSKSPWGTPATAGGPLGPAVGAPPAFGTPSFGQTSTPSMGLGDKASPWTTGSTAPSAAFGQSGGLAKTGSPFGTPAPTSGSPASSGFAAFASKGGFTTASNTSGSIFGTTSKSNESPFSKPTGSFGSSPEVSSSPFGTPATKSAGIFGAPSVASKPSGLGGPFVLGSTFKADPSAKDDEGDVTNEPKSSFFGGNFGGALSDAAKPPVVAETKDENMDADDLARPEPAQPESTTPISTPAAPKTQLFPSTTSAPSGLFGLPSTSSGPPPAKPVATGFSFGQSPSAQPKPGGFFANLNTNSASPSPKTPTGLPTPAINPFAAKTPVTPLIKPEPVSDTPVFSKIPEAPLPPDPVSKTTFATGESSTSSSIGADAPLPPDFAPKSISKPQELIPPLPEQKPITADLIPPSDVPGGPEDDGESSGFLTEEDEDEDDEDEQSEEGSGEDVAKDLSPVSEARPSPGFSPESSFGGIKTRSSESSNFSQVSRPGPATQPRSLFGEIGSSAPNLPPPNVQQSPRSPSPIRTVIPPRMSRPDATRCVSAPGAASQILKSGSHVAGPRSVAVAPPASSSFNLSLEQREAEEKRRIELKFQRELEATRALEDAEDDRIQQFLASDVEPKTTLDEFDFHADYVNSEPMESVPAQVETVYRDINSMIDTLGLNARKLKSFIQGHTDLYKEEGRSRNDLEDDNEWCLVEVEDLSVIVESELTRELESGRVRDVAMKLESCNSLQRDMGRLRAKHEDAKKIIDALRDPNQLASARAQPLSAEQSVQQNDLRRDFTTFQKLLSEAEEALTLLKAKIVSNSSTNGKAGGKGPTVEAVMRTITKMTSMAEKRSGDVDVLEGQMRKLRFSSTASFGSREGSPFMTPQKNNRVSFRNAGTSSTYGLFYTPDSVKDTPQRFQSSIMSSTSSLGRSASPRKKLTNYTTEEKWALRSKLARKREVTDKLKAALAKTGTHVRTMDDE